MNLKGIIFFFLNFFLGCVEKDGIGFAREIKPPAVKMCTDSPLMVLNPCLKSPHVVYFLIKLIWNRFLF